MIEYMHIHLCISMLRLSNLGLGLGMDSVNQQKHLAIFFGLLELNSLTSMFAVDWLLPFALNGAY